MTSLRRLLPVAAVAAAIAVGVPAQALAAPADRLPPHPPASVVPHDRAALLERPAPTRRLP